MSETNQQLTPMQELKRIEQVQTQLLLNVNHSLKREVEKYLKKQGNILEWSEEEKKQAMDNMLEAFLNFTNKVILHQERANKVKNKAEITAQDLDYQYIQVNYFNQWATKQMELYYQLKNLYYLQKSKKYQA